MKKEISEGNYLIAEFMGLSYCDKYQYEGWYENDEHNHRICDFNSLKYHSSWDWIMLVVKRIREIINTKLNCSDYHDMRDFENKLNPYDQSIDAVWNSAVKFINWYNLKEQENENN